MAAVRYFCTREHWVILHSSPILYRYVDWPITVPLQMIEFYLAPSAVQHDTSAMMFYHLLIGTVLMLAFGYRGQASFLPNAFVSPKRRMVITWLQPQPNQSLCNYPPPLSASNGR